MSHAEINRAAWTSYAPDFRAAAEKCWATDVITWGIWDLPEAELNAFGAPVEAWAGLPALELGCGTAYFSAWLAKAGVKPVGLDLTPAQLVTAREMQERHDLRFPLIEGNAEHLPFPDGSFDLALSEYGASIWCDPYQWIPEAARVLRPGGTLIFLRNSPLAMLCAPDTGTVTNTLLRPGFGLHRMEWADEPPSVEFNLMHGEMIRLLRQHGFEIEALLELQAPADAVDGRFDYMSAEWAKQWPSEEIWRVRRLG
ncbi:MAG: class I SAM-dependent methyltransferase [Methanoregulaceae archaeon]|nr:class I SAM-dependent methyltransferase [Methanoregulaceae archaeon]